MIVNRNELKRIRSRRTSQYKQNPNIFNQIQIQQFPTLTKYLSSKRTPLIQMNTQNYLFKRQQKNYSNNQKHQGTIRSNRSSICEKQPIQQSIIKKTSRVVQNKKMSLDVNLSNKSLKTFIVELPNGINFRQIYSLNLSGNQIKQILPTLLTSFEFLKQLNLKNNKMQKVSFPYNKMQLRKLQIQQNNLSNLNLEHLKNLQYINASQNRLIFITLPESLKLLSVQNNQLSNTYFLQKCTKIQQINISYNFIYDLNFNSFNNVSDNSLNLRRSKKTPKYLNLVLIQCGHNKISHLNGFYNILQVRQLNIEFNDLSLSRQNLNEIFQLEQLQKLNIKENHLEGPYSVQTAFQFLFDKLNRLKILNGQQKDFYIRQKQIINQSRAIEDQSTIKADQNDKFDNSQEKPFRLFLDEENNQNKHLQTNKKPKKQWHFTLGDTYSPQQQCSQIYKKMTKDEEVIQKQGETIVTNKKSLNQKSLHQKSTSKYSKNLLQSQRIYDLQKQLQRKNTLIQIPYQNIGFNQKNESDQYLDSETRTILNLIFQMSFYPPIPLSHNSNLSISKRIDQDEDQFTIFSKLFLKNGGIAYLRKFYLLEQHDKIFQNQIDNKEFILKKYNEIYSLGFVNCDNIQLLFKQLMKKSCSIQEIMNLNPNLFNKKKIQYSLSPVPNSFHNLHIAIRYLSKSMQAFQKRSFAPVYYLIESKKM